MKHNLSLIFVLSLFLGVSCVPVEMQEDEKSEVEFLDQREKEIIGGEEEASRNLRMGDRIFVESVFKEVFGDSIVSSHWDQAYRLVYSKQGVFGGGCDLYEKNWEETGPAANNYRNPDWRNDCFQSFRNNSQVGLSTTVRAGWTIKFCEYTINRNPAAVAHAYNKAGVDPVNSALNMENYKKLHKLFYPLKPIPNRMEQQVGSMSAADDQSESWDMLLLALCVSPDWQIP